MINARWNEVRLALSEISNEAMQYDANGVEICFLNSDKHVENVSVSIGSN
jgi:hypothetical protein